MAGKAIECVIPEFHDWHDCIHYKLSDSRRLGCEFYCPDKNFRNGACVRLTDELDELDELEKEMEYLEDELFSI